MPPRRAAGRGCCSTPTECVYEFMVGDLDAWIDALRALATSSAGATATAHAPRITREDYVNLLLLEDLERGARPAPEARLNSASPRGLRSLA